MIPLKDCTPLQLAILSARAMGMRRTEAPRRAGAHEYFLMAVGDERPEVYVQANPERGAFPWDPARDMADACTFAQVLVERLNSPVTLTFWPPDRPLAPASAGVALARPATWCGEHPAASLTMAVLSALGIQGWEDPDV